jgi:hypothetical protein
MISLSKMAPLSLSSLASEISLLIYFFSVDFWLSSLVECPVGEKFLPILFTTVFSITQTMSET